MTEQNNPDTRVIVEDDELLEEVVVAERGFPKVPYQDEVQLRLEKVMSKTNERERRFHPFGFFMDALSFIEDGRTFQNPYFTSQYAITENGFEDPDKTKLKILSVSTELQDTLLDTTTFYNIKSKNVQKILKSIGDRYNRFCLYEEFRPQFEPTEEQLRDAVLIRHPYKISWRPWFKNLRQEYEKRLKRRIVK